MNLDSNTVLIIALIILISSLVLIWGKRKAGEGTLSLNLSGSSIGTVKESPSIPGHFVDPSRMFQGVELNGFINIEENPPECPGTECKGVGRPHKPNGTKATIGLKQCQCDTCNLVFLPPQDLKSQLSRSV